MAIIVILALFFSLQVPAFCIESESVKERKNNKVKNEGEPFFKELINEELTIWS